MRRLLLPLRKTTVCTLILIAFVYQWHMSQMYVKNALLNDCLKKEVYMVRRPIVPHTLEKFVGSRTLYMVSSKHFAKFSCVLTSLDFHPNHHDPTPFLKCTTIGCILLSLYVDDMIIIGDDDDEIAILKSDFGYHFEMKDLGSLGYFWLLR